jgi:hypothetical protein
MYWIRGSQARRKPMKNKDTFLSTIEFEEDLAYAKTLVKLIEVTGLTVKQVSAFLNSEKGALLANDINYLMWHEDGSKNTVSLDEAIDSVFNHYQDTDTDFNELILQK